MPSFIISRTAINDLCRFIAEQYPKELPNSLLIAQEFILKYPDYGKEYGLPVINKAIEDGIKQGLFKGINS